MAKQKIIAKEFLKDIKSGMSDPDLMKRYELSSKGLESAFKKLVEVGVLEASVLKDRAVQLRPKPSAAEMPRVAPAAPEGKAPEEADLADPLAPIAADIQAGLHDSEIMRRHDLSPGKLAEAKKALVDSGRLAGADVREHIPTGMRPCPFCRQVIPQSAPRCPHCNEWLDMRAARAAGVAGPGIGEISSSEGDLEEDKECPWEDREAYGTMGAYIQTVTKCLLTPTRFFSKLPPRNGYLNPILFGVMSTVVSVVLAFLWAKLFFGVGLGFLALIFGMIAAFVVALIVIPIVLFIWSGIVHAFLCLLKGANEGFQATFRVAGYASVTNLFHAIPLVGTLASLWQLVLTVIGLRETHKTSTGKAVGAVLISTAIVFLLVFVGVLKTGSVWSTSSKRPSVKLGQMVGRPPTDVCAAVEEFVAQVDGAQDLDDQDAQAHVNEALKNLNDVLKSHKAEDKLSPVRTKALAYGLSTLAQRVAAKAPKGGPEIARAAGDPDKHRRELLDMCGK